MWDGKRPAGRYISGWGWLCFNEVQNFMKFFKFNRNAFHRYMQSIGYDVTLEKIMDGLKENFIIVVVHGREEEFKL